MNADRFSIIRTIAVFTLGGLLAGFVPMSTPGPKKVISAHELIAGNFYALTGTVQLLSTEDRDPCELSEQGSIGEGTRVFIENRERQILATGVLGEGEPVPLQPGFSMVTCNFPLTVENIPQLSDYILRLEGGEEFPYSWQQLARKNWQVELTLVEP